MKTFNSHKGETIIQDKPKRIAVGYIRVSTKIQAEQGISLEAQEIAIESYCAKHGYLLEKVFRDEGKTGRNLDRKGLRDARAYCRKHKDTISYLVFFDLSRLCRNTEDQLALLTEFDKTYGIKAESVNEKIEDTAAGKLLTTILGAFNQFQSDSNGENTKAKMLGLRMKGYPTARPCLGYKVTRNHDKRAIHIADPPYSDSVIEIFCKMKTGSYSPKDLLDHMTSIGFLSKRNKPLTIQSFMKILSNKTYLGKVKIDDSTGWIDTPYVEALIDSDAFYQVQAILKSNKRVSSSIGRSYRSSNFALTVFTMCTCGGKLTGGSPKSGSGKSTPYYHCRSKCGKAVIPRAELEEAFYSLLGRIRPSNGLIRAYRAVVEDVYRVMQGDIKKELALLEKNIETQQTIVGNMIDRQYGDDKTVCLPQNLFNTQIDKREMEISELKEKRDMKRRKIDKFDDVVEGAFKFLTRIDQTWLNSDTKVRRNIQQAVFPDGLVYEGDGTFRTPVTSLAFNVIDFIEAPESHKAPQTEFEQVGFRPGIGNNIIFLSWVVDSFKL